MATLRRSSSTRSRRLLIRVEIATICVMLRLPMNFMGKMYCR